MKQLKKEKNFYIIGFVRKQEIFKLINFLKKIKKDAHRTVSLMYCVSSYPADKKEIDLNKIIYLSKSSQNLKLGTQIILLATKLV